MQRYQNSTSSININTASRYHRQERDDFAKENIMFDIFCCSCFIVVTAVFELMVCVCVCVHVYLLGFTCIPEPPKRVELGMLDWQKIKKKAE